MAQRFASGLLEDFRAGRSLGQEIRSGFGGRPTVAEQTAQSGLARSLLQEQLGQSQLTRSQTSGQLEEAEFERFTERSNLKSVFEGAIQASRFTDEGSQNRFLEARIIEGQRRGDDMRDSIELLQTPFEDRAPILKTVIELGFQQGFGRRPPQARQGPGFTNIQQTTPGQFVGFSTENQRFEAIPSDFGAGEQFDTAESAARSVAQTKQEAEALKVRFDRGKDFRQEVRKVNAVFDDVTNAYGRILASSEASGPFADIALVFNYMKMLDPGSVVRESEFALADNAGNIPENVRSLYNKLLTTDGRLTIAKRKEILDVTRRLYNEQRGISLDNFEFFAGVAKEAGVPRRDLRFPDLGKAKRRAKANPQKFNLRTGEAIAEKVGGEASAAAQAQPEEVTRIGSRIKRLVDLGMSQQEAMAFLLEDEGGL